jgi:CRP-like cAMP-binding protein
MYRDYRHIPVKKLRYDPSSSQYMDVPVGDSFLKGPIPLAWLNKAATLPGKAINLGIAIWWLHGMSRDKAFKLTGKALAQLGISRDAASSALKGLEAQGLIRVQRSPGQRPTVEILLVPNDAAKPNRPT